MSIFDLSKFDLVKMIVIAILFALFQIKGVAKGFASLLICSFRKLAIVSICWSVLDALLQIHYVSLRYRSFGPRPLLAMVFIGLEGILVMLVIANGFIHVYDEERAGSAVPYWLGMIAVVGAWIGAAFIIQW